ncbi:MAG TPA: hypothetical protein VHO29_16065 [Marmoricola sp.]|nr:hypothetical protein [Marmoricola sp.]
MTTVTGTGALHDDRYALSPVSPERLEAALGPGAYLLDGTVFSDDRTAATTALPLDGECRYYRADEPGVRRLTVTLADSGLPFSPYGNARATQRDDVRAQPIAGTDGYVITEEVMDLDGSVAEEAVAAVFDGSRVVIADILVPTPGVQSGDQAVAIALEATAILRQPMQSVQTAGQR